MWSAQDARLRHIESLLAVSLSGTALRGQATAGRTTLAQGKGDWRFQRVGMFANYRNAPIGEATMSETVAATADGRTLVDPDSERGDRGRAGLAMSMKPIVSFR